LPVVVLTTACVFGAPLNLNRLSGGPDSNRRDWGNVVNGQTVPARVVTATG